MAKAKETQETKGQQQQQGERQKEGKQQPSQAVQTTGERGGGQQTGITRREQYAPTLRAGGSPFAFMRRFSEEMDRLFDDFGFGGGFLTPSFGRGLSRFGDLGQSVWSPQVEVFKRGGQLVVRADLPGMTKDDINIDVTDDALVIRGERKSEREENEEGYYRSERSYGSFYRQIPLPEGVNAEDANATFRDGVLEITMQAPQREEQRSRRLEIQEASAGEEQPRGRGKAAGQK
jgi:HSP20 family protein